MNRKRNTTILTHILIWAIYIFLPILAGPPRLAQVSFYREFLSVTYTIAIILSISFYYFNYFYILPKYYAVKKYSLYIVSVFLFIILSTVLMKIAYSAFPEEFTFGVGGKSLNLEARRQVGVFLIRLLFMFIASFGFFIHKRLKQIEIEKVNSELLALKSQINPHFLFNILNDIYGQAIAGSDKTAKNILKLSSIMRYVITETSSEYVLLEKEIKYLENYIELQKTRLTERTKVSFQVDGNVESKKVPPLLFINFIENAFKYGISTENDTAIDIKIEVQNENVIFTVTNEKTTVNTEHINSYEIGISNTKKRLELLFGGSYDLKIEDDENTFKVYLRIDLK